MTDAEYVNWSECWIQDRKSTATITEAEYSFRFANDDDEQQEEGKEPTPIGQELVVLEDTLKKLLFYLNDIGVYVAKVLVTNSIDKKLIPFRKER